MYRNIYDIILPLVDGMEQKNTSDQLEEKNQLDIYYNKPKPLDPVT